MKKILIVHNQYQNIGGEDVAVINEVKALSQHFTIESIYFDNSVDNFFRLLLSFIRNSNKPSNEKILEKIFEFKPDIVYFHNTWFKISLGIFEILENLDLEIVIKIHNFRYFCTRSYFSKNHLQGDSFCNACGLKNKSFGLLNKYFQESFLKSILAVWFGKKYFTILKRSSIKKLVLTQFHKNFLEDLKISDNVFVIPNINEFKPKLTNNTTENYIVYAGRISEEKGFPDIIEAFLASNLKQTKFKIIGNGPLFEKMKNTYVNERIVFTGVLENKEVLRQISSSLAVVTGTKLHEGQPTLLSEAAMLGVPSIFPRSGGIQEFFPDDYALSYEKFNFNDFVCKLNLIHNSDFMKEQASISKSYFHKNFGTNRIINLFEEVFDDS